MASIDAYHWTFEVESSTTDTWLNLDAEVTEFEVDYSSNGEEVDATTFASDGTYEGRMIQRGASLKLTGFYGLSGGTRSTSQARVQTLGTAVGTGSVGRIRWRHNTETSWRIWSAYVALGAVGGGNADLTSWEATFTKTGAETTAAV